MTMIAEEDRDAASLRACDRYGRRPERLIEMLHAVQADAGHISDAAIATLAAALNRTRAEILGVVSFYHDFRRQPAARRQVRICRAEACQAAGGDALAEAAERHFGIAVGETAPDGSVSLEPVYCLGNCALSPAMTVDGQLLGRVDADALDARLAECATREAGS